MSSSLQYLGKKGPTAIFVIFSEDKEERRHAEQAGRGRAGM